MIVGQVLKQAAEKFSVVVNFAAELSGVETVMSCLVTARDYATGADTTGTLIASTTVATPMVIARLQGGAAGQTHIVQFLATTSAGNLYESEVEVMMIES